MTHPTQSDSVYRFMVIFRPGVSIMPDRYVRVVVVEGPRPEEAVAKAMAEIAGEGVSFWQSKDLNIQCERVA